MKGKLIVLFGLLLAARVPAQNYGQIPAPPQTRPIALVGATVHPVSAPEITNATIIFEHGRISALGREVDIPPHAERIEVTGKHVYPAFIDAHTTLGLVEIGAVRATRDFAETGQINPNVRAEVAVNPDGEMLPVTRANGVALALSVPQGGLLAGTSALLMLDGWTWEQMTLQAPVGLHVNWPAMTLRRGRWITQSEEEQRKQMQENLQKLKEAFAQARAYRAAKAAEGKVAGVRHETDSRWEAMIPVFEGTLPVFVTANEIKQIQAAVQWAQEENLKLVIVGGQDAWRAADLLQAKNVPVIYGPVHDLPGRDWEAYDTPFTTPAKLHAAGVKFCIADFENANARNLPYQAAMAAAYGLPREEALKAITLYPAEILGVADRVGSLAVGKDATLIVTNGDPLEIPTRVEWEFIQGRRIDLGNKHEALYRKYSEKYRQREHRTNGKAGDTN
ncbi:MAG: amidohydrolase family protein [candidate division KSB1 bacterium]|nr:amidohydrolase family protein [candidate division KSB1 bacterium]MDZ7273955.1 amidohydrolase family protein [candidate division KSB1 bacterium]MDZ7286111.1 amidohydrolase family protein [candidate division KSB1 bacterium]MDZ7299143.1 amidohydrolase family protein [candidate division KSB1 bacterium]MDZ7308340.1 amidohydrolase family protein [candidate division KSB1 bacterium]